MTPREGSTSPPARPISLPDHVRELIEQAIIGGRLRPGQRVSENYLAAAFDVSRTPVREAVRMLEGQGLIVRSQYRGTYISSRTSRSEAEALYEMRVPLEAFLTGAAAEHITRDELEDLDRLHVQFVASLGHDDPEHRRRLIELDAAFHSVIYQASRSDLFTIVNSYWARLRRELSDLAYRGKPPIGFAAQHAGIIAALRGGESATASELMAEHVRTSWEAVEASYAGTRLAATGPGQSD